MVTQNGLHIGVPGYLPRVVVFHHLHFIDLLNNVAAPVVAFAATWIHVTDKKPN